MLTDSLDKEWTYRTTLKDKKHALAEVQAKLHKQTYCPGLYISLPYYQIYGLYGVKH